jgi:SAM-dependent methyltransferase
MYAQQKLYQIALWFAPLTAAKVRRRWFGDDLAQYRELMKLDHPSFVWMNYGLDGDDFSWIRDPEDMIWKYQMNLARHTFRRTNLRGKRVLDTGSGRGGTCSYVQRYHEPARVAGLDQSDLQVNWCNQRFAADGIKFYCGDAQQMPFDRGSFDVVSNIESACHYPAPHLFYREVYRVLAPGGFFCHSCNYKDPQKTQRAMERAGFRVVETDDITDAVTRALVKNDKNMREQIRRIATSESAARVGARACEQLAKLAATSFSGANSHRYYSWILQRID